MWVLKIILEVEFNLLPLRLSSPKHPRGEQDLSSASQLPPMWPTRGGPQHLDKNTSMNPADSQYREPCTSVMITIFLLAAYLATSSRE